MSAIYFLVTAAVLFAVYRISRKKMIFLRKELRQKVPYHDRYEIMRLKLLIAWLGLVIAACITALFAVCVYQVVLWLAAH